MSIQFTPPPITNNDVSQQVITNVDPQLKDGTQLLRGDLSDFIKIKILQLQLAESLIKNNQQQITTGLVVRDEVTDRSFASYNQDTKHFAASVNKLAVAYLLIKDLESRQRLMEELVALPPADQRLDGAGKYDKSGEGNNIMQVETGDLLFDMLNRSGNTAVRALVNLMGGASVINERLAQVPEIPNTRLIILPDPKRFYLGDTTPKESLFILRQIYERPGQHADFVRGALATNIFSDFGVRSQVGNTETILLTNKHGALNDPDGNNRHDVGIIRNLQTGKTLGYSMMTTSPNASQTATMRAEVSLQEIGRNLLRYAGDQREKARNELAPQSDNAVPKVDGRIVY